MVAAVLARYGRIDVLVNDAFWGPPGSLEQTDEAFWDRTFETCWNGPYQCTRALVPTMKAQGSGAIADTGSLAGKIGEDDRTAYGAAKWGLDGLSAALRVELHRYGIRAHLISPGATDTSFWRENAPWLTDDQPARFIPPETIADVLMWVLSTPEAAHIPDVPIHDYRDPFEGKGSPFER